MTYSIKFNTDKIFNKSELSPQLQKEMNEGKWTAGNKSKGQDFYYRVYTKIVEHKKLDFWKFTTGLKAFALTVVTLGFGLLFQRVRHLWNSAIYGQEILKIKIEAEKILGKSDVEETLDEDKLQLELLQIYKELLPFFPDKTQWDTLLIRNQNLVLGSQLLESNIVCEPNLSAGSVMFSTQIIGTSKTLRLNLLGTGQLKVSIFDESKKPSHKIQEVTPTYEHLQLCEEMANTIRSEIKN